MKLVRKFLNCTSAVVALEFYLVVPFMLILWFGIVEVSSAYLVMRRVEVAAQSAADLIAQNETVSAADITDIGAAIDAILNPYPDSSVANKVGYNFASIVADAGGTNMVGWSRAGGSRVVADPGIAVATGLTSADDSVIVVTVEYSYSPALFDYVLKAFPLVLTEIAFARPRLTPIIPDPTP